MALYNKFRSQTFGDIKGQETAVRILKSSLIKKGIDGVPQVMIFVGPHGTGKTSMAKIEAKALNCENMVDGEPCGKCQSCLDIARDVSPCVTMLDAAANGDVAHVRDIIEDCKFVAAGNKKVYILDEVQMFSTAAWNALLKTLEEPPKDVFFILCTTESLKIAATAKSRCQEVLFKAITPDVIKEQLVYISEKEGIMADDEALAFIAESADGHMRDAISDLEKYSSYDRITKELILDDKGLCDEDSCRVILESILSGENAKGFETLAVLQKKGKDMKKLCGSLIRMITDSILGNSPLGFSEDLQVRLQKSLIAAYPNLSVPQASFYLEAVLSSSLKEESVIASLTKEIEKLKSEGICVSAPIERQVEKIVPFETLAKEEMFDDSEFLMAAEEAYSISGTHIDEPVVAAKEVPVVKIEQLSEEKTSMEETIEERPAEEPAEENVSETATGVHVRLFQIKCLPETDEKWFKSYDYIERTQGTPFVSDYECVLETDTELSLEEFFMSMQDARIPGYKGRSMSVSDICQYDGKYFFVDRIGFKEVWEDGPVDKATENTVEETPVDMPTPVVEEAVSMVISDEDAETVISMFEQVPSDYDDAEKYPAMDEGMPEMPMEEVLPCEEVISEDEPDEEPEVETVTEPAAKESESESLVGKVISYEDMIALAQGDKKVSEIKKEESKGKEKEDSILTMSFFDDFNTMFSFGKK